MKMARAIPVLSGGTAAVLVMMAAAPALASPGRAGHSRSSSHTRITSILQAGDTTTGVRGSGGDGVVLTGLVPGSGGSAPFLFRGRLARAAGAAVSVLHPAFRQVTSATFYGPNTHLFNPRAIPRGQIRAVGSYISSAAPQGVHNQGMIYLGPLSGRRRLLEVHRRARVRQARHRARPGLPALPARMPRAGHHPAQHDGQPGGR